MKRPTLTDYDSQARDAALMRSHPAPIRTDAHTCPECGRVSVYSAPMPEAGGYVRVCRVCSWDNCAEVAHANYAFMHSEDEFSTA